MNYENPLPGVPIIESPFFDHLMRNDNVDAETLRVAIDLRERGYAVIDFPEPDIEIISRDIKNSLLDQFDLEGWRSGSISNFRLQDAWSWNADVKKIAVNRYILDLLERLYGRPAFPFQTLNFPVGTQQHYHTDSVHFSSMPERFMCGVWLALEDIGADQGPLLYYPGSHKWPIYCNEHIKYMHLDHMKTDQGIYHSLWQRLIEAHGVQVEYFYPKKGQALIWAANLLHGGDLHRDKSLTRWSQVTHYYFNDCAYYTPMCSDEPYGAVEFREPIDVRSGIAVRNSYTGKIIPDDLIRSRLPNSIKSEFREDAVPERKIALPEGFDAVEYLLANPDVAASGFDAAAHYLMHGHGEGRSLRPESTS